MKWMNSHFEWSPSESNGHKGILNISHNLEKSSTHGEFFFEFLIPYAFPVFAVRLKSAALAYFRIRTAREQKYFRFVIFSICSFFQMWLNIIQNKCVCNESDIEMVAELALTLGHCCSLIRGIASLASICWGRVTSESLIRWKLFMEWSSKHKHTLGWLRWPPCVPAAMESRWNDGGDETHSHVC